MPGTLIFYSRFSRKAEFNPEDLQLQARSFLISLPGALQKLLGLPNRSVAKAAEQRGLWLCLQLRRVALKAQSGSEGSPL